MIKIVFFDIDGTLRPFETRNISEGVIKSIKRLQSEGILTAIATGRHWLEIYSENLLSGLQFDAYVTQDGGFSFVPNPSKGRVENSKIEKFKSCPYIFKAPDLPICAYDPILSDITLSKPLPKEDIETVLSYCEKNSFSCLFQEERNIYLNRNTPELSKVLYELGSNTPPILDARRALIHPVYMMIPVMDMDHSHELESMLKESAISRWSDGNSFDITSKAISKSQGVKSVLDYFGILQNEASCVGDGENDASMIEFAGLGISLMNGHEKCKSLADFVAGPSINDGAAEACEYILSYNLSERNVH